MLTVPSWRELNTRLLSFHRLGFKLLLGLWHILIANLPSSANRVGQTGMTLNGCQVPMLAIDDTALSLLEISFEDGLADTLH